MSAKGDRIEQVRRNTIAAVMAGLTAEGWSVLPARARWGRVATLPVGGGVLAVAEVSNRGGFSMPADWPVRLQVSVGAGYEPLLAQLPLVGKEADPFLLRDPQWERDELATDVRGPEEVETAAAQLLGYIRSCAVAFASRFDGPDALLAELERERLDRTDTTSDEADDSDEDVQLDRCAPERLVLLAMTSSPEAALTELAACRGSIGDVSSSYPRFARQVTRWLDAGAPPPPPLEQTMAILGGIDEKQRLEHDRGDRRADRARTRERTHTIAAGYRGDDPQELQQLLAEIFAADGDPQSPSALAIAAQGALDRRSLGGRLRNLRLAGSLLLDAGRNVKDIVTADPASLGWLRAREADRLPVTAGDAWIVPTLRPDAYALLERVRSTARRRMGPVASCEVWLSREDSRTRVHLGEQVVADVEDETPLAAIWRAAELMDERPLLTAWLTRPGAGGPLLLELRLPD